MLKLVSLLEQQMHINITRTRINESRKYSW